ncbi:hypothetical protein RSal33209_1371 [Renibacterium salmoninarum ATCC 33209]|uniref:Uncharacterized protein n=1 Tax=Renibacterium salmoninarum (strain ATCC 33209 / DSM 20767 / JCM 11484 / NBRC 15589 / NCIMB 2235) TaxID=288705 RepID=A9WPV1_RENSM|nr:hypothetical protein RSal33209_1371 [Renibacterium salmoninarum ATCC 33209]
MVSTESARQVALFSAVLLILGGIVSAIGIQDPHSKRNDMAAKLIPPATNLHP